jgi:hypothetical protein
MNVSSAAAFTTAALRFLAPVGPIGRRQQYPVCQARLDISKAANPSAAASGFRLDAALFYSTWSHDPATGCPAPANRRHVEIATPREANAEFAASRFSRSKENFSYAALMMAFVALALASSATRNALGAGPVLP